MSHYGSARFGLALLVGACASSAPPPASPPAPATEPAPVAAAPVAPSAPSTAAEPKASSTESGGVALCDVVCAAAVIEHRPEVDGAGDIQRATQNANLVLDGVRSKLLSCFPGPVRGSPGDEAFLTLGIVVGTDGKVMRVQSTGGESVSPAAKRCVVQAVSELAFEPPTGHGTMQINVPFTLRPLDESL